MLRFSVAASKPTDNFLVRHSTPNQIRFVLSLLNCIRFDHKLTRINGIESLWVRFQWLRRTKHWVKNEVNKITGAKWRSSSWRSMRHFCIFVIILMGKWLGVDYNNRKTNTLFTQRCTVSILRAILFHFYLCTLSVPIAEIVLYEFIYWFRRVNETL